MNRPPQGPAPSQRPESPLRPGSPRPHGGRRQEADRNDERLVRAAREVFAELGWDAPVSAVARRAGIGMGSLYRRFPSKEELARWVRLDGMNRLTALAEQARADEPDPWSALAALLRAAVRPGREAGLLWVMGGRTGDSEALDEAASRMMAALDTVVGAAQRAGALRDDVTAADIVLLLEHLGLRLPGPPERVEQLRHRYLDLMLDSLHGPTPHPLTGPPPDTTELLALWNHDAADPGAGGGDGDRDGDGDGDGTTGGGPNPAGSGGS